jgi:hypothetical protein
VVEGGGGVDPWAAAPDREHRMALRGLQSSLAVILGTSRDRSGAILITFIRRHRERILLSRAWYGGGGHEIVA